MLTKGRDFGCGGGWGEAGANVFSKRGLSLPELITADGSSDVVQNG